MKDVTFKQAMFFFVISVFVFLPSCKDSATNTPASQCIPLPPSTVAFWTGDSTVIDVMSGLEVKRRGYVTYQPGVVNQAFFFPGGLGNLEASDTSVLDISGSVSIVAWVRFNVALEFQPDFGGPGWADFHFVAEKGDGGYAQRNYGLYFSKADRGLYFDGIDTLGTSYVFSAAVSGVDSIFDDLEWHLLVASWDRQHTAATVSIDGIVRATAPGRDEPLLTNNLPLRIGAANTGQYLIDGAVDEFMVMNQPIDAATIAQIMANGSAKLCR